MLRAPMGLGLTVKPFYVYVLTLKMNQSLSQNIRHINTTIKILWGPPKCGGPGHVPPVPHPPKSGPDFDNVQNSRSDIGGDGSFSISP